MMNLLKKNMVVIIVIVLGIVGTFVYMNFFSGSSSSAALLTSDEDTTSPVSKNLLLVLNNLHTIKLDSAIFSSPAFQSLTNFGVEIPPENVGRRNPFEPLSGYKAAPAGAK